MGVCNLILNTFDFDLLSLLLNLKNLTFGLMGQLLTSMQTWSSGLELAEKIDYSIKY